MGVASWLFVCLGCSWSGPAGGCCLRKIGGGWLSCTVVWGGWLSSWCRKHACCCLVWWWWVPSCVCVGVARCRGSGAVRPGCLARVLLPFCGVVGCGCGWVGCELYSGREHLYCRISAASFLSCVLLFVFLSVRWMPWHRGPMKDVVACDIPRGAGWRAVIRGFPNGGTRHELCRVTCI